MEVLYPRCAGLDVHQQTVVACARVASGSTVQQEVRTFGTATKDLLALADWLTAQGCTHVAMESTGVYWKPIWHVTGRSPGHCSAEPSPHLSAVRCRPRLPCTRVHRRCAAAWAHAG
jgi:Transposase